MHYALEKNSIYILKKKDFFFGVKIAVSISRLFYVHTFEVVGELVKPHVAWVQDTTNSVTA